MTTNISVIIPTHNRAQLLQRALNSVLAQTCQPQEIIVVDDGSTDNTAEMLSKSFEGIRYIKQPHQGVSSVRNHGIRESRGEWLAFLDSDDEWLPDKLQRQMDQLASATPPPAKTGRAHTSYLVCHTNEIWIRRGKRVNQMKKHAKYGGYIFQKCLPLCVISPSAVLIHRSIFQQIGGFDETLTVCEDYDLWLRICACYPVLYLDTPLIKKYGGHADQLSRLYWGMDRFRIQSLEKFIKQEDLIDDYKALAIEEILRKIDIYLLGAAKRGKTQDVKDYQEKKTYFQALQKSFNNSFAFDHNSL